LYNIVIIILEAQPANRTSNFWSFENLQVKRRGLVDVVAYGLETLGCSQSVVDTNEIFLETALKMFVLGWGNKQSNL
jgi:hypothetical protein